MKTTHEFVLTLSCRDTTGIVHAVSGLLYQAGCNIIDSQQFGDVQSEDSTGLFFMRVHFAAPDHLADARTLESLFSHVREQFQMTAAIHALARTARDRQLGRTRPSVKIQLAQLSGNARFEMTTGGTPGAMLDDYPGFSIGCFQLRPRSRGQVHVASADAMADPVIDPRYLTHEDDCADVVASVRLARQVASQPALAGFIVRETRPSEQARSDDELLAYVKKSAATSFHPVGTCRMGADEQAVVDAALRVRGVDGLRVIDSSVMPTMPSSNTNAASIMVGEKGADLVLGR